MFSVGDKVVRSQLGLLVGDWSERCRMRGHDPRGVYTISRMGSVSLSLREMGSTLFLPNYFLQAVNLEINLDDFM